MPDISIFTPRGRELVNENTHSYGSRIIENGFVLAPYSQGICEPVTSDVSIIDGISKGYQALVPNKYVSFSLQPYRGLTMFSVINSQVADKTSGGILGANGSSNMIDYLGGTSIFDKVIFPFPDQIVGREYDGPEYEMYQENWKESMERRNRFISPASFRFPTDQIAQAEPLMTNGYFDSSAQKVAFTTQWHRALPPQEPEKAVSPSSFAKTLATSRNSAGRGLYDIVGLVG